jgi:O-antigen ligase
VVLYYLIRQKQRVLYYFLFILGFSFLAISLSRSAFVALAVGVLYIFLKNQEKGKKLFWAVIVFVGILFLLIGAFKTTLFSRIYFIEAILGFLHNLSGVGIGNFIKISANSANQVFGVDFVSSFAHNIILEVLTGMGVLGLTFVYFVFDVSYSIFKNSKNVLATAVFFAIFTNFFFDTTYVVSGMFWLWFISLGLAQSQNDPVFAKIARYGKKLFKRAK